MRYLFRRHPGDPSTWTPPSDIEDPQRTASRSDVAASPRDELTSSAWEFSRVDGPVISRQMRLLADGRVGGHTHPNERRWRLDGAAIDLLGADGLATTRLSRVSDDAFEGPYLPMPSIRHRLRRVAARAELASPAEGIDATRLVDGEKRPNLVVLRANEASLHTTWTQDLPPGARNWDLCVSWYGAGDFSPAAGSEPEYSAIQRSDRKYTAIHKLFHTRSELWSYERVMFPDDDLMMSWHGINLAFDIVRDYGLMLAQPSLDPDGHVLHNLTRYNPDTLLRFTSFVEVMTPVFSREALRLCAPTFGLSASAFGLDHVWPKLIGEPRHRIAVIDAVRATHTRPMGEGYNLGEAVEEGKAVRADYSADERYVEFGRIYK